MRPSFLTLLLSLSLFVSRFTFAQETTGAIAGRIADPQHLPISGAAVTVIGPQGSRATSTDLQGRFSFPFLTPGIYAVKSEATGFKTTEQQGVVVKLGATVELDLSLELGVLTQVVEVKPESVVIDMTSTTLGINIESDALEKLPMRRRFSETLYMAPGVSSSGGAGVSNPSVAGGSGLENTYIVDGVSITNAGFGALGSYSIPFGSLGNGTPYDFVHEVQVKTGGYEAEFGQSTGGIINVVTKSGSNNLNGSVFAYGRPARLENEWTQLTRANGAINTIGSSLNDVGATVGGPIVKNQLFIFAAADPQWETRTFIAPEDFPLRSLGDVDRERHVFNYAVKTTYNLRANHRFDGSFFGDPGSGPNGIQRPAALLRQTTSAFSELDRYGGHNQGIRYLGVLKELLVEASFSRALNSIKEIPAVDEWSLTDTTVIPFVRTGGLGPYEGGNKSLNRQYAAKATSLFSRAGSHEVKFGFGYQDIEYDQDNRITGPSFTTPVGDQTGSGAIVGIIPDPTYGRIYSVGLAYLNGLRVTTQTNRAFFVQDTWRVGRTTVRPGIRYDAQDISGTLATLELRNNWAPRIGATFDVTDSGRVKVFGHYGRYFAQMPNDLAAKVLSSDGGIAADYFDAGLTRPIPNGVLAGGRPTHYAIVGAEAPGIDPNAKSSYFNEYASGVDFALWNEIYLGVHYVHRDIARVLEDVTPFPVVAADLGIPGSTNLVYTLTNPSPATPTSGDLGARFEKPTHRYDALELVANKRLNRWSLEASYRWSRLFGNYEGFYREDNGQADPGITTLFDFPTNDPSYTSIGVPEFGYRGDIRYLGALGNGPLPLDRPHQTKIFSNYSFEAGVNVAMGLIVASGKPLTAFAANPNVGYRNGGEIPEGPRGSGIQTLDGFKTRTPYVKQLDARIDYSLRLGDKKLVLSADVFNVFDARSVLDYDSWTEAVFGVPNPGYGQPVVVQTPRVVQLGVRFEF
jgi:Carboxypeptidase regulatory-like domain/TonB-dependent Receptor Plug Domain